MRKDPFRDAVWCGIIASAAVMAVVSWLIS